MFAYSIGENTGLQFQTTLSIVGEKPALNDNASGEFAVQMEFGKNPRWVFPHHTTPLVIFPMDLSQSAPSTFILSYVALYDATTNRCEPAWFVLDIENEMALFSIEREEQIYIAAAADKSFSPEDIINHFQSAIDMMDQ